LADRDSILSTLKQSNEQGNWILNI
jgi:hypothetical protein